MSVNTMSFEQSAAFLELLYEEATGQSPAIKISNTADFTSVGTTLLQGGLDPIIGALAQVLDRTIFAMRVYNKKFDDITIDEIRWGAVTRKVNFIDNDLDSQDNRLELVDGQSIDMYSVKKPKAVSLQFYGATQYSDHITVFRDQLDSCLRDSAEFGRFMAGVMTNIDNKHKQIEEAEARGMLINFITAKALADPTNCINVLQAYYDETGTALTPQNMFAVANYTEFTRWLAGFMTTLADKLAERTQKYHMNVSGKELMRFTDSANLRKYISANVANYLETAVAANLYNPERLSVITGGMRKMTYWQNFDNPYSVKATPAYLDVSDGTIAEALSAVQVDNIIGVLFDRDALGMVKRSTWSAATPFNADGGYYNLFWHWTQQTYNDFTENFVVLYAAAPIIPSVSLNKSSTSIAENATETLTATTVPADATVVWASSDETVATVDEDGVVTGVAAGTATITATIEISGRTYTDECEVTITT